MPTRKAAAWAAVSGLVGTCMLGISFAINTGPPAGAIDAQVTAFGQQHLDAILWGAWLQAVGPVLIVVFALAIVVLAGTTARLAGWMTLFGAATLMTVSLVEITGYLGTLHTSPATIPETSLALIHSVQHPWFIVAAPALWLQLGLVILGSGVLPRVLGYLAIVLAAGYALAGVVTLLNRTVPPAVQTSAGIPVLWWLPPRSRSSAAPAKRRPPLVFPALSPPRGVKRRDACDQCPLAPRWSGLNRRRLIGPRLVETQPGNPPKEELRWHQ